MEIATSKSKSDMKKLAYMGATQEQVALLSMNPDYEWDSDESAESRKFVKGERGIFPGLDDLNELGTFKFVLHRESETCPCCNGSGQTPEVAALDSTFHGYRGNGWGSSLTQDEADALLQHGRLGDLYRYKDDDGKWCRRPKEWVPTLEEVNAHFRNPPKGSIGHDGFNRSILLNKRAERLGYKMECDECEGNRVVFPENSQTTVRMFLWMLLPRKMSSWFVNITDLDDDGMTEAINFLDAAKERMLNRFSGVRVMWEKRNLLGKMPSSSTKRKDAKSF